MSLAALALLNILSADKVTIKDLKKGTGPAIATGDLVSVNYVGKLKNGKTFDSNKDRPPFTFVIGAGQVIKGWEQGLLGGNVGATRQLTIPASLGYGKAGTDGIPGNSTLIFEVEILKTYKPKEEQRISVRTTADGTGEGVEAGDQIDVHYKGSFLNGLKFDSSYDRSAPLAVTVEETGLIKGFTQGLIGMKLGEKRRVEIPPSLGYGDRQRGPIPPNSTLVFELELMKLTKKG
jgi:FKBP-type peptidyl-prolyl cis-trans isomerase